MPICLDSLTKIGIITTTMGVLLTNADIASTVSVSVTSVAVGRRSTCRAACADIQSSAPVRTIAPTMMNSAAMVQGAVFENTFMASSCGRIPRISMATAPASATTSTGYRSNTKATNIARTMMRARIGWTSGDSTMPNIRPLRPERPPRGGAAARGRGRRPSHPAPARR